jgi:OOP family OmpA-OmpF porin
MKARLLLAVLFTMFVMGAYASKPDSLTLSKWKIGVATGYHGNVMRFPGLSQEFYYDRDMGSSALILLSAEYTLPQNFSIRPEIGFLNRGGTQYLRNVNEVRKGIYNLKATYFDIRVPVIYNIPLRNSNLQPYIYVAPVAGFVAGGKIKYDESLKSGKENRYNLDLSHSTIASSYFACMVGAGVKYPITILGINCSVGLELGYEYGFTNTYSRMERHNESIHINHAAGDVAGPRKNSGFEVKASLQVPLTIFQRREKPQREKIVE